MHHKKSPPTQKKQKTFYKKKHFLKKKHQPAHPSGVLRGPPLSSAAESGGFRGREVLASEVGHLSPPKHRGMGPPIKKSPPSHKKNKKRFTKKTFFETTPPQPARVQKAPPLNPLSVKNFTIKSSKTPVFLATCGKKI